jgi:hypothetical protein
MHALTTDEYDKRLVAARRALHWVAASRFVQHLPHEKPAVEIWKAKKPASHGLDDWIYVFSCPLNSNHRHGKGLVADVSGPQRNASRFTHP